MRGGTNGKTLDEDGDSVFQVLRGYLPTTEFKKDLQVYDMLLVIAISPRVQTRKVVELYRPPRVHGRLRSCQSGAWKWVLRSESDHTELGIV